MEISLQDQDVVKLQDILMAQLNVNRDQITADADIMKDLLADSLDVVSITMEIEEQFDVTLPDDRIEQVRMFGELCEELAKLLRR